MHLVGMVVGQQHGVAALHPGPGGLDAQLGRRVDQHRRGLRGVLGTFREPANQQ